MKEMNTRRKGKRMDKNNRIKRNFDIAGVYLIRNRKTGMVYIGSSGDVFKRIASHWYDLKNGKHPNRLLQADYDAGHRFDYELLYSEIVPLYQGCKLHSVLKEKENYFVEQYNSINAGYNIIPVYGGPNSPGRKHFTKDLSGEQREIK